METNNKRFIIVHHLPTDVLPRKEFSIDFYWTGTFSACTRLERNEMRHCSLSSFEFSIIIKFLKIMEGTAVVWNEYFRANVGFIHYTPCCDSRKLYRLFHVPLYVPSTCEQLQKYRAARIAATNIQSFSTSRSVIKETTCFLFTSMRKVYSAFT